MTKAHKTQINLALSIVETIFERKAIPYNLAF